MTNRLSKVPAFHPGRAFVVAALLVILAARPVAASPQAQAGRASRNWTIAPPASWVDEPPLPARGAAREDISSGILYLLADHQVRVGAPTINYYRQAWTPVSSAGVQNASEIEIAFDPSYERLVIHHVRLLRNGHDVFSFKPADVQVIQREADLDEQIYSGELTALVLLRDLRQGDTLDYAYSIEGTNPILGSAFDDDLPLAYESPVRMLREKLTAPAGMQIFVKAANTDVQPKISTAGAWRSWTWEARDVPPLPSIDDTPGWYDPDPHVQVSTFESWQAVAAWATALFENELQPSADIRKLADRFRSVPGGVFARATAATRFVQDEVRYLGVEMGPNSHQPHPPEQVLRQRFGDCKDKSLLLVALLRELGVDAAPALTDTSYGRGLDNSHPSPFEFDHAIVQAVIDGRTVWIDPTESGKGGSLENCDPPPFERALVLRPGTDKLSAIALAEPREPLIDVEETYTIGPAASASRLDVTTTYRQGEADWAREVIATTAKADLAKELLDYYAGRNPDIRALHAPRFDDDRERNVVKVTEAYEIGAFWTDGERQLFGWRIRESIPDQPASTRSAPLAVEHPVHVRHRITVRAPAHFRIDGRRARIDDPAFAFTSDLAVAGSRLTLTFDYRSLADAVPAARMRAYQQAIGRVKEALTVPIDQRDVSRLDGPRLWLWLLLALTALALSFGGHLALRRVSIRRARRANHPQNTQSTQS
jgi:transglutaminase-like putative cysteine protease